jgi:hypothetical protein
MSSNLKKTLLTHKKRAGGVVQGVGPEFKPQYHQALSSNTTTKVLVLPIKGNSPPSLPDCPPVGPLFFPAFTNATANRDWGKGRNLIQIS